MNRFGFALLAAVALLLFGAVRHFDLESVELNNETRALAPGAFARLPMGVTHYSLDGPADASRTVILIHGFNGPMSVWDRTAPVLVSRGYRVLNYDLLGRGYSDRPDLDYSVELFAAQLNSLIAHTGLQGPFTLIASSFGSLVATEFTWRNPQLVDGVVLIGPAGFPAPSQRWSGLLEMPGLSALLYRLLGDPMQTRLARAYYAQPDEYPEAHAAFAEQLKFHGHKRAALSTLRNVPLFNNRDGWQRLAQSRKPVLVIWGRDDVSFPWSNHELALELIPQAQLRTIEATAHLPQYEAPQRVNPLLESFIRAVSVR